MKLDEMECTMDSENRPPLLKPKAELPLPESPPFVVYTDCPWVLDSQGKFDYQLADLEYSIFEVAGIKLKFGLYEQGKWITEGERFLETIKGAEALAIYRARITPEIINATKKTLKIVGRIGVGYDNLNVNLLNDHNITGFNIPDYCTSEVATHTVSLMLALERGIFYHDRLMKSGGWNILAGNVPRRTELLTAGIIGLGRIGKAVAIRLKPFYKKIIAFDPYVNEDQMCCYGVEKVENLYEVAERSDVVTVHCELSTEKESSCPTQGMINKEFFQRMKKDAFFVNAARGAIVDQEDLLAALQEGHLAGAGLDVFSPENPQEHSITKKLAQSEKVIAICHRAFLSRESLVSQRKRAAINIVRYLKEKRIPEIGCLTKSL